jgi:hypothetical protein
MFVAPRSVDENVRAGLSACGSLARPASRPLVPSRPDVLLTDPDREV